jgi:hypothetical protein
MGIQARLVNGSIVNLNTIAEIGQAEAAGATLIRPDKTPFIITPFMEGTLLDYLPMNIYTEGRWYKGQQEALAPYWDAGTFPRPTGFLGLPVVDIPVDVSSDSGIPWWAWAIGGYALYRLVR